MEAFDRMMASLDYPLFVVTARTGGERAGCVVGFATQASIKPARFLVGLSEKNRTFAIAREATHLAVHAVSTADKEIAELFGGETGDEADKFARCAWHDGPEGLPIIDGLGTWFAGRILERIPLGDHTGHLLEPVDGRFAGERDELGFQEGRDIEPGHAP